MVDVLEFNADLGQIPVRRAAPRARQHAEEDARNGAHLGLKNQKAFGNPACFKMAFAV